MTLFLSGLLIIWLGVFWAGKTPPRILVAGARPRGFNEWFDGARTFEIFTPLGSSKPQALGTLGALGASLVLGLLGLVSQGYVLIPLFLAPLPVLLPLVGRVYSEPWLGLAGVVSGALMLGATATQGLDLGVLQGPWLWALVLGGAGVGGLITRGVTTPLLALGSLVLGESISFSLGALALSTAWVGATLSLVWSRGFGNPKNLVVHQGALLLHGVLGVLVTGLGSLIPGPQGLWGALSLLGVHLAGGLATLLVYLLGNLPRGTPRLREGKLPWLLPQSRRAKLWECIRSARHSLHSMADGVFALLMLAMNATQSKEASNEAYNQARTLESGLGSQGEALLGALEPRAAQSLDPQEAALLRAHSAMARELKGMGHTGVVVLGILRKTLTRSHPLSPEALEGLYDFLARVMDFQRYLTDWLGARVVDSTLDLATTMEQGLEELRKQLAKQAKKQSSRKGSTDPLGDLAYIEILGYLDRMGDHGLALAREIAEAEELLSKEVW